MCSPPWVPAQVSTHLSPGKSQGFSCAPGGSTDATTSWECSSAGARLEQNSGPLTYLPVVAASQHVMPVLGIVFQGHQRRRGLEGELWAVGFFCQGGMSEEQGVKAAPQKQPPAHPAAPTPFPDTAVPDEVPMSPGAGLGTDPRYTNLLHSHPFFLVLFTPK